MVELDVIKNSLEDELIENDTYKIAFSDLNVFINYVLSINETTKYQKRQNRILVIYNDNWMRDVNIEVTSFVENDFVEYSNLKLNNSFTVRVEYDGGLIALTPKPVSGIERRQAWDENFETLQSYLINIQNMRDELIEYCVAKTFN